MEKEIENDTSIISCNNAALPESIQNLLPSTVPYHVCQLVEEPSSSKNEACFTATFRLPFPSEKEFLKWLKEFQRVSFTTWRVKRTFPRLGKLILFKKLYRCQHNTRIASTDTNSKRRAQSKNTNCNADMMVSIKTVHKHSGSKNVHLPQYPTEIVLKYTHNHPVFCADALKFRDVSKEAAASLKALFKQKLGPTAAVEKLKYELQLKHGDNFPVLAADRSICPDVQYAHRLYRKLSKQGNDRDLGEGMIDSLEDCTNHCNAEKDESTADELRRVCEDMIQKLEKEPVLMDPAFKEFLHSYKHIQTSSHLCSAMYAFGKYQGPATSLRKVKKSKKRTIERLSGSKTMGVQPTSLACKRGKGRQERRLTSGLPTEASSSPDHDYTVQSSQGKSVMPVL